MVTEEELFKQGPAPGESLLHFLERVVYMTWKGADEPVHTIPSGVGAVKCVCGFFVIIPDGVERIRCPGCGCRYQLKAPR